MVFNKITIILEAKVMEFLPKKGSKRVKAYDGETTTKATKADEAASKSGDKSDAKSDANETAPKPAKNARR